MPLLLYVFSFLIYVCFFTTDVLIRINSVKTNSIKFIFYRTTLTTFFVGLWVLISGDFKTVPTLSTAMHISALACVAAFGIFGFVEANKHLAFANILSINIIGIILQQLIAYFILKETASLTFVLSFVISVIGLSVHGVLPKNRLGLFWALVSSLGWSIGYSLLSVPLKFVLPSWGALIIEITILIFSFLAIKLFNGNKQLAFTKHNYNKGLFLISLLTTIGAIMVTYSYKVFKVAHIGLVNIWLFPVSLVAARLVFKEKITNKEWIGNALIVLGVVIYLLTK